MTDGLTNGQTYPLKKEEPECFGDDTEIGENTNFHCSTSFNCNVASQPGSEEKKDLKNSNFNHLSHTVLSIPYLGVLLGVFAGELPGVYFAAVGLPPLPSTPLAALAGGVVVAVVMVGDLQLP